MITKLFVDTNVFIRFFLNDHKTQSPAAKKLFNEGKTGRLQLFTSSLIVAEIVFTLHSVYRQSKEQILEKIKMLVLFKGLVIIDKEVIIRAISFYEDKNIDFIDGYVAAFSLTNGFDVCSYDRDFEKIKEVKRINPAL